MNIALIFAGGSGTRMHSQSRPKQFLMLHGKPILIYTIEVFENAAQIDAIVVVCIKDWIPYLKKCLQKHDIGKVVKIIEGGNSGSESIFKGLCAIKEYLHQLNRIDEDDIVLIHDGVRPLIYESTINDNISKVRECGSCITVVPAIETIFVNQPDGSLELPPRDHTKLARAPQSFYFRDIYDAHHRRITDGLDEFVDSCSLMNHYGYTLGTVNGPMENIKITTPTDFYLFRAIVEAMENQQIFGLF